MEVNGDPRSRYTRAHDRNVFVYFITEARAVKVKGVLLMSLFERSESAKLPSEASVVNSRNMYSQSCRRMCESQCKNKLYRYLV